MKYVMMLLAIEKLLLHIIPELLPTKFHFDIKSHFQNHPL